MFKKIHVIINPASGKIEPILPVINEVLHHSNIDWDVSVTHKSGDAYTFAKKALAKKYDAIAVYGGDGSVMEVARALYKKSTPLIILPGGTANVMAKELNIPDNLQEAMEIAVTKKPTIQEIDMGMLGKYPFLIRVNVGFFADMVTNTGREMKKTLGRLAYPVTMAKEILSGKNPLTYSLLLDGKRVTTTGVSLMITNSGSIGLSNFSIAPNVSVTDGKFDVIVLKEMSATGVYHLTKAALLSNEPDEKIEVFQASTVSLTVKENQTIVCDDVMVKYKRLTITNHPKSLRVVTGKV